jgi:hypothetical protein
MGGAASFISGLFGGGPKTSKPPEVPDYEAERKKAEKEAEKKRAALADKGMSGAILGGSAGDETTVKKKKLLGE